MTSARMSSSCSCRCGSDARLIGALLLAAIPTAQASPFQTRDQNPLLAGFGLPGPMPTQLAESQAWSFAADLNWSNTALVQSAAAEALIVDAETRELRVSLQRPFGARYALRLEIPYRHTGPGELDRFIDDWHDAFGMSEGARAWLPNDVLRIAYERNDVVQFDFDSPGSGPGDITAGFGMSLRATTADFVAAWLNVKLPTGDTDELTGSGAVDVALVLGAERRLNDRWSIYGQGAMTWLGEGELLPDQQRSIVWSALAGVSWRIAGGLALKAQVDAHTEVFEDSQLDFLGSAVILTVGGDYRFASGWQLEAGVSEDIALETSSDVVFILGVSRGF
jgi:Protein of unknown function (DUF3187)